MELTTEIPLFPYDILPLDEIYHIDHVPLPRDQRDLCASLINGISFDTRVLVIEGPAGYGKSALAKLLLVYVAVASWCETYEADVPDQDALLGMIEAHMSNADKRMKALLIEDAHLLPPESLQRLVKAVDYAAPYSTFILTARTADVLMDALPEDTRLVTFNYDPAEHEALADRLYREYEYRVTNAKLDIPLETIGDIIRTHFPNLRKISELIHEELRFMRRFKGGAVRINEGLHDDLPARSA